MAVAKSEKQLFFLEKKRVQKNTETFLEHSIACVAAKVVRSKVHGKSEVLKPKRERFFKDLFLRM